MASAAASCIDTITWLYKSIVIPIVAWPSLCTATLAGTLFRSISVALVCLRSWKRTTGKLFFLTHTSYQYPKELGMMG